MDMDDFLAVGSETGPKDHVPQNRVIEGKAARRWLVICPEQRGAEGLIANLRLELEKLVARQGLHRSILLAGKTQVIAVFVHPLVDAPSLAAALATGERGGHDLVKFRLDGVVGVQNVEELRFRGKIQTTIKILEQTEVRGIARELTGEAGKTLHQFLRPVR